MKKIIHILESFFPSHKAGTEIYVYNLVKNLPKSNFESAVLISSTDRKIKDYSFQNISVSVFHIPKTPSLKHLNGLEPPAGLEEFQKKILSLNPDIVHFHSFGRGINSYHLEWAKKQGIKTVFTTHLGGLFCIKGNLFLFEKEVCDGKVKESRCLSCYYRKKGIPASISNISGEIISSTPSGIKNILPPQTRLVEHRMKELERIRDNSDAIVALDPYIKKMYERNGITQNVNLVRQGVNMGNQPVRSKRQTVNLPLKACFIGRLYPIKGFHLLARAIDQLKSNRIELHIFTLASENEKEYFEEYKNWADSRDNVFWYEGLSQAELFTHLPDLDLVILPSLNEMAPLSVLEAFSFKVPVLGSSIPSIESNINDGVNGRIFKVNDEADLKNRLNEIIHNPDIVKTWSSNIKKVRTSEDVAADMIKIYNSI